MSAISIKSNSLLSHVAWWSAIGIKKRRTARYIGCRIHRYGPFIWSTNPFRGIGKMETFNTPTKRIAQIPITMPDA